MKIVFGLLLFISIIFVIGTIGACEFNPLTPERVGVQMGLGSIGIAVFAKLSGLLDFDEKNRKDSNHE